MAGYYRGEEAIKFAQELYWLWEKDDLEELESKIAYILRGGTLDAPGSRAGWGGPTSPQVSRSLFPLPLMDELATIALLLSVAYKVLFHLFLWACFFVPALYLILLVATR